MKNNKLRPYEDMKNSRQDWLNEVPNHWKLAKAKRIFRETSIKNYPDEELLSATQNRGVIPRRLLDTRVVMPMGNFESFKLVKEGNFVISLRSFQGGLEYSKYQGIVSPAYNVLEEYIGQNRMYFKHLMKSKVFISELQRNVTGIRQGKNIDVNDFKEIVLPIPPRAEQDQIVGYLDYQMVKINKFIKAKKKLIAVLKEQKQAIINEAVTKGLDPNVKMKQSGIEWLGEVPEHWEVIKLKYLTKSAFQYGANESGYQYEENSYRYIRITDISQNGDLKPEGALYLPETIGLNYRVKEGDILFARSGATVGKSFLFKDMYGPSAYAGYLIKFAPFRKKVLPEFVYFYTMSSAYSLWLNQIFIQSTIQNVSAEKYKNLVVPLPSVEEQSKLLIYIKERIGVFDKSILRILSEIELIQEYKNSLISDVVTGKVDVRNIAVDELEEEIIQGTEYDEDLINEESLEEEDGDE